MGKKNLPVTFLSILVTLAILIPVAPHCTWSFIEEKSGNDEGVLQTDDISVILQGGGLWIKITPMEEEILRYCTEDTRQIYRNLLNNQGKELTQSEGNLYKKFFVQFRGQSENETYFDPTELNINQQGKLYKPEKIIPITSTFDKRILKQYENPELAIYAFNKDIDLERSIKFQYKDLNSIKWDEIIQSVEEAKLLVR
jgi:hypothetical protein